LKREIISRGFTLLELIIVIVVIGILATLGFISYTNMIEKSRSAEVYRVFSSVRQGYLAQKLAGNGALGWSGCGIGPGSNPCWQGLVGMDNPNENPKFYFGYQIDPFKSGIPTDPTFYKLSAYRRQVQRAYASEIDSQKYIIIRLDTATVESKTPPY